MKKSSVKPADQSPFQQQSQNTANDMQNYQMNQLQAENETTDQQKQALSGYLPGSSGMSEFFQFRPQRQPVTPVSFAFGGFLSY